MDAPQQPASLLSLATELLLLITDNLDSPKDLCNLCATCSRLQEVAEPLIWHTLEVTSGTRARKVFQALQRRPQRKEYIQDLKLCYATEDEDGIEVLDSVVQTLENLRHFTLETPCPFKEEKASDRPWSPSKIDYEKLFQNSINAALPSRPFTALQSVHLHGHASKNDPFHLGCSSAIFAHPTLRDLTLVDFNIDLDLSVSDMPPHRLNSTPLQNLTFEECNVHVAALDVILRFPKSLRNLSIDEVRYHNSSVNAHPTFRMQPTTTHPDFLHVIARVAPTLEKLVHNSGRLPCGPESGLNHLITNFKGGTNSESSSPTLTFPVLTHLETSMNSLLLSQHPKCPSLTLWRINNSNYLHSSSSGSHLVADHLEMKRRLIDAARQFVRTDMPLSQPLTLDLVYTYDNKALLRAQRWWLDDSAPWTKLNRLRLYELALVLKAHGSRVRIFGETMPRTYMTYVPPFLYGEPRPREVCIYDSEKVWEIARKDFQSEDRELVPPHLRATCRACRVARTFCVNNGYGTQCEGCTECGSSCDYTERPSIPQE